MQKRVLSACVVSSSLHHIPGEQRTPLPMLFQHVTCGSKVETFHKLLTAVTHMPGTIRTCQKFLIQYNRRQLLILLQNCTDEGEREAIQKSVTRSCLLEEEEESGEEAAEAME
ncbi:ribonuclease P/MRP protein subunit POP5 isoform X6 [Macaca fascicularis]|uniref:ribonuclease P/MRP protein subunit POP5 isoform X6 n=1 Tax=Macaca fascicularis TaxID=9541 RepID=UPI003D1562CB